MLFEQRIKPAVVESTTSNLVPYHDSCTVRRVLLADILIYWYTYNDALYLLFRYYRTPIVYTRARDWQ
jgi:hypothetical protein